MLAGSRYTSLVLLLGLLLAWGCSGETKQGRDATGTAPIAGNLSAEVAHVGMEACRDCHVEQFDTYAHTGMGRAFYPMTAAEAVEDFHENNEFSAGESGLHYRMTERDGSYYQQQFLVDSRGKEIALDEHRLDFVIGSNRHSRSYVITIDDRLFQAPVCWYPEADRWELCPGYEFKNDHFSREIGQNCIQCHNGKMTLADGLRNRYEKPYPQGIGCERCHGPGQLHVAKWRGGAVPTGNPDPTIVHPRRLPPAQRIEICFQCHLGDARATERVIRADHDPTSYRPGQLLTDYILPYHYEKPTRHGFGLSAQADRLLLSRCYTESGGKIECLTCHNPHVTVYRKDRPLDYFRQRCLSCHQVEDCKSPQADRQATSPLADDCAGCHMRKAEPDDQRFTEFTDHWIRRDIRGDDTPDPRESYAIEPMLPDIVAGLPEGERAYYQGRAVYLLARDAPSRERPKMWQTAEASLSEATEKGFATTDAWFFLGKVRRLLGRRGEAELAFRRAFESDPAHHDAAYALGQAHLDRGDTERALEIFQGMLQRQADDPMALAEMGRAFMMLSRPEEALSSYSRAIEQEPWDWSLRVNRGKVLAASGRLEDALPDARDAVRLNPDEPRAWGFYEKLHDAVGRGAEAEEGRRILAGLKPTDSEGAPEM